MKQKIKAPEKILFSVRYSGLALRFQGFLEVVQAYSRAQAVKETYKKYNDKDYFVDEETGDIYDCDKNLIYENGDESIYYDGGYFYIDEAYSPEQLKEPLQLDHFNFNQFKN